MRKFIPGFFVVGLMMVGVVAWGQNYQSFNANGSAWTSNNWSASSTTNACVTTGLNNAFTAGRIVYLCTPNGTGTGSVGIQIGGIIATEDYSLTGVSGTMTTGGTVVTINVASARTVDLNTAAILTAAGTGFNKTGLGAFAFAGSTYPGGFTLNAGTFIARGILAFGNGPLILNGGTIAANNSRAVGAPSSITIGGNIQFGEIPGNVPLTSNTANISFDAAIPIALGGTTRTLTLGNAANHSLLGVISGTGGLTFAANANGAAGVFTLAENNTYTGRTRLTGGIVQGTGESIFGASPGSFTADQITFNGGTLRASGNMNFSGTRGITLEAGGGTFNTNGNTITLTNVVTGSGGFAKTGTGTLVVICNTGGTGATYTGATNVQNGTLQLSTINNALSQTTNVTLANTAGVIFDLNDRNQTIGSLAGGGASGGNTTLGTGRLTVGNATPTTYAGIISETGGITKQGAGTLTLTGANTYTGSTIINAGTLSISTIANGLTNSNIGASSNTAANLVLGGGTLQYTGANASTDRAFTLMAATTSTIDVSANTLTISGAAASTSGALVKAGAGTLILSGANAYTGTTAINAGVLNVQNNTALGTVANGTTVSNGAALEIQGGITIHAEALGLNGTGVGGNGAFRNISGTNSFAGAITLAAASTIQSDAGALTLSGNMTGAFDLTLEGAAGGTVSGVIGTTAGTLTKNDAGTWILTGANTYTGTTTINGGTLQLNKSGGSTLANSQVVTINSGGTLRVSTDQTLTGLTLNTGSTLTVDDGVILTITSTFGYNGGTINSSGTAAMAYAGTGVIIYAGNRTAGIEWTATNNPNAVTINGAAVVTLAANATTPGNLTINSTAQLVGTGFTLTVGGDWSASTAGAYAGGLNAASIVILNGTGTRSFTHTGGATFRNLTFSGSGTYTINSNINISVNTLTISNGIVVVGTNTLNGSGGLSMSGGILRLAKLSTPVPELSGTYALSGGTIELNGTGDQILENAPSINYFNLTFSGNGTTTLDGATSVQGLVTISTANTVLDVFNNSFGGATTAFTMTAGRFRTAGTSTKPDMEGTYNLTGGVVEFYNSLTTRQAIRNNSYQNIEVTGTNVGNSDGNITLNSGGSFTVKSAATFNMNANSIEGPTVSQTVTIENGGTFNCGNVEGLVGPTPAFGNPAAAIRNDIENIVLAAGSTINYTRDITFLQKITARSDYSNVTISGGGEKTIQGATTINGAFTLTDGPVTVGNNTLTLNGSIIRPAGGGTLTMATNSSLSFGTNSNPLTLPDGLFTSGPPAFANLTINRAGGVTLGNQAITLSGNLGMTNGLLTPTASGILTLASTATTSGGSDGSFVNGPMSRVTGTSGAFVFPLGKSGAYKPLTFTVSEFGGSTFTGEYFAISPPFGGSNYSTLIAGVQNNAYWDLTRGPGSTEGTVTLPYTSVVSAWRTQAGGALDLTDCWYCNVVVVKREGTQWVPYNAEANKFSTESPNIETTNWATAGTTNVVSKVINSFSPFTFGVGLNTILTLPVQLLSFDGQWQGADAQLQWQIADDKTLAGFELQHSTDGNRFSTLASVAPFGQRYQRLHSNAPLGANYYRLKTNDKNGSHQYSRTLLLVKGKAPTIIGALVQNPIGSRALVQVYSATNQRATATLTDVAGRTLARIDAALQTGHQQLALPLALLLPGQYYLHLRTADGEQKTMPLRK
jgi:autotransporter-associated beta strand protein